MPNAPNPFVEYVLDLLAPLGEVRARAMFGGYGIYCDGLMFALIAFDALYFKADDANKAAYLEAGSNGPFVYDGKGKPMAMSYYEAPADAMDDQQALLALAHLGLEAAQRKPPPKRKPKPKG